MLRATQFGREASSNMNIAQGFQIEQPKVFVPWRINDKILVDLFSTYHLRKVTNGQFNISCVSLGGLHHELAFNFKPRVNGALVELEIYLKSYRSLTQSFKKLQSHVEATFGAPSIAKPVRQCYPEYSYTWNLKGVRIEHHVRDSFLDADRVIIKV